MKKQFVPVETFFLEQRSGVTLQRQIRENIVNSILAGHISPASKLPSSRRLAAHLGVSRLTVTLAYQELVAQGYLISLPKSGYSVSENAPVPRLRADQNVPENNGPAINWDDRLASDLLNRRRVIKPRDWRHFRYPFIYGQMDSKLFDHTAWRDCARQALGLRYFDDLAGDMAEEDDPLLVDYISSRTLPRRGISASPEEILVTVGAQNALWITIELLTRRRISAICEKPGHPDTIAALRWNGARISAIDIDDGGLPIDQIPERTDVVFVTPSHQSPTGVTMPRKRRDKLLTLAQEMDFVVVEDDYEFEMSYLERPTPALKSLDHTGRVIYVGSFSKAMFPGLRIGYLVAPSSFIRQARQVRSLILRHPPGHMQRTVAYFLALGHYDKLVQQMRIAFQRRHQTMLNALADTGINLIGESGMGGTSLWTRGPDGLDAVTLARKLQEKSVLIEPGAPFFDDAEGPNAFMRLGFSSIEAERIPKGIEILAQCIHDLR